MLVYVQRRRLYLSGEHLFMPIRREIFDLSYGYAVVAINKNHMSRLFDSCPAILHGLLALTHVRLAVES